MYDYLYRLEIVCVTCCNTSFLIVVKYTLQYFGHLMQRTDWLEKTPDAGKDWRQEKGTTEDEMVGWHDWLDGHESEQALGVGDGQGGLACFSPWGSKESDTTERLNWTYIGNSQVKLGFLFNSSLNIILFVYLFLLCCLCCHAGFPLVEESKATL